MPPAHAPEMPVPVIRTHPDHDEEAEMDERCGEQRSRLAERQSGHQRRYGQTFPEHLDNMGEPGRCPESEAAS